ncbi:hypothetical protein SAMN04488503_2766 [Humidesulfovibrio mexicanus]|uniref:Uncharacterized protein n=1 Tax=Humidesulfovibrio mexicanus TaxID=147047 RepID=A0A239BTB6_9BACT|nr:hypothetical protein SAMN04488503_2766 [Humidesulfovibrio mexicanus]
MLCARRILLVAWCTLLVCPNSALAGLWAHGSEHKDRWPSSPSAFYSDYALIGGKRTYSYKDTLVSDAAFDRIFDERHDRFIGFGPEGDATLTVDESLRADVEAALGRTTRLNLGGYEERVLCYASSRPGDDTVALFTLSKCPENCQRVSEIQIRARKREVRVLSKCAKVPGVHAGIATQSGLHLGMTGAEVEAVLGTPQHIQKGLQGTMWFYAASVSVAMSREEAARRGFPGVEHKPVPGTSYCPTPGFDKFIVLWLREGRVSAWRVWLDWGL